jgi:hypothetical protein
MTISYRASLLLLCLLPALSTPALADGNEPEQTPSKQVDQSSANFKKTQRFLPGEEVVTPTGQKLKVWSSEGPVPVSRAAEPFEDREKSVFAGGVVIDAQGAAVLDRNQSQTNQQPQGAQPFLQQPNAGRGARANRIPPAAQAAPAQ